jgi:hypothetical protein
VTDV